MRLVTAALLALAVARPAVAEPFDCVINPSTTVRLGAPVAGLLDEVLVDRGDPVTRGQPVARLRSEVERVTVEVLTMQAETRAEIEAQESRLKLAEQRNGRVKQMVERGIAPLEELESSEAELEVVRRELAIAQMQSRIAALELERASQQLAQREIRSPITGFVLERRFSGGEFLAQEEPVIVVAAVNPLHVEAYLPVDRFGSVVPGARLVVRPEPPFTGDRTATVEVVDRVFDAASGTFGVRLVMENADLALPAGQRCQLEVPAGQ